MIKYIFRRLLPFTLCLFCILFSSEAQAQMEKRIALISFFPSVGVDPALTEEATNRFRDSFSFLGEYHFLTEDEMTSHWGDHYKTLIFECKYDTMCLTNLMKDKEIDGLVLGVVSRGVGTLSISVKFVLMYAGRIPKTSFVIRSSPEDIDTFMDVIRRLPNDLLQKEQAKKYKAIEKYNLERHFGLGLRDFFYEDYASASSNFSEVMNDEPDKTEEAMAHYYLGLSKYRAGDYEGALRELELAGQMDEKVGAHLSYYVGVIEYNEKKYKSSRALFQTTIERSKDPVLMDKARGYIKIIDLIGLGKEDEEKFWSIDVSIGSQLDSNVSLQAEQSIHESHKSYKRKVFQLYSNVSLPDMSEYRHLYSGVRAVYILNGKVKKKLRPFLRVGGGLKLYQSLHFLSMRKIVETILGTEIDDQALPPDIPDVKDYDTIMIVPSFSCDVNFKMFEGIWESTLDVGFGHTLLRRKSYSQVISISPSIGRYLGKTSFLSLFYKFESEDHRIYSELESINNMIGLRWYSDFAGRSLRLTGEAGYDKNDSLKKIMNLINYPKLLTYQGYHAGLGMDLRLQWGLLIGVGGEYHLKDYSRNKVEELIVMDVISGEERNIDIPVLERKKDNVIQLSAFIEKHYKRGKISLCFLNIRNNSSELYKYSRFIASLMFTVGF